MAKENGTPTAAEKGKGKATDEEPSNGQKKGDEVKKDKDGKPIQNGTKGEEPQEGIDNVPKAIHSRVTDPSCRGIE